MFCQSSLPNLVHGVILNREGNCCADKLVALGHSIVGEIWLDNLPDEVKIDFYRDRCGLPNYGFP